MRSFQLMVSRVSRQVADAASLMSSNVGVNLHVQVRITAQGFCGRLYFMEILGQSRGVLG
jgi:hypothetical protein